MSPALLLLLWICGVILPNLHHWNSHFPILCSYFSSSDPLLMLVWGWALNMHLHSCGLHPFLRNLVRMGLSSPLTRSPLCLDPHVSTCATFKSASCSPMIFPALADRLPGTSAGAGWGRASVSPVTPVGSLGERGLVCWLPYAWLLIPPSLLLSLTVICPCRCSAKDPEEWPDSRRSQSPGLGWHLGAAAVTHVGALRCVPKQCKLLLDAAPPVGDKETLREHLKVLKGGPFLVSPRGLCCLLCIDTDLRSLLHILSSSCQLCFSFFLDTWFISSKAWHLFCARNSRLRSKSLCHSYYGHMRQFV